MITERDIKIGALFKLLPGPGSHSKEPYVVRIVDIDGDGFSTEVFGEAPKTHIKPHIRRFNYNSLEWNNYHKKRFVLV
jgi:hypothetical protein